jgi:hypothetical protein
MRRQRAFGFEHGLLVQSRIVQQALVETFRVTRIPSDAQLKTLRSRTIDLLIQFIAGSNLSFRRR